MSESTMVMPSLGETMEHGIVAAWLVEEGQSFSRGDPLIEFETDKTAVEYPALGDGVLLKRLVKEGDQVVIGAPVAIVDTGDGPDWLAAEEAADVGVDSGSGPDSGSSSDSDDSVSSAEVVVESGIAGRLESKRATPAARRLARIQGIELNTMVGTGRRERIEQGDVESAIHARKNQAKTPAAVSQDDSGLTYIGDIACEIKGDVKGTPCVMLHGFSADHTAWALLSRSLVKAGRCAVAVDLPGHGKTRCNAHHVDDLSVGLDKLLEQVASQERCHLIAHSLGAVPAVNLALSQASTSTASSVASLTLIAPVGLGLFIDTQFVTGMAAPASRAEITHLLRRLSDRPVALSFAAIDALYESLEQGRLRQLGESFVGSAGQKVDLHNAIASLAATMPVRIITGHADRILDWQDVLHVSPKVAVHHLLSAGHMPHWDEPRAVADIILSAIG